MPDLEHAADRAPRHSVERLVRLGYHRLKSSISVSAEMKPRRVLAPGSEFVTKEPQLVVQFFRGEAIHCHLTRGVRTQKPIEFRDSLRDVRPLWCPVLSGWVVLVRH